MSFFAKIFFYIFYKVPTVSFIHEFNIELIREIVNQYMY
jgi:hypothetical protein